MLRHIRLSRRMWQARSNLQAQQNMRRFDILSGQLVCQQIPLVIGKVRLAASSFRPVTESSAKHVWTQWHIRQWTVGPLTLNLQFISHQLNITKVSIQCNSRFLDSERRKMKALMTTVNSWPGRNPVASAWEEDWIAKDAVEKCTKPRWW